MKKLVNSLHAAQAILVLGIPAIYAAYSAGHMSPGLCGIGMCLCWLGAIAVQAVKYKIKKENYEDVQI